MKGNTLLNGQVIVLSFHMHLKYTLKLTLTFFFPVRMTLDQKIKNINFNQENIIK